MFFLLVNFFSVEITDPFMKIALNFFLCVHIYIYKQVMFK